MSGRNSIDLLKLTRTQKALAAFLVWTAFGTYSALLVHYRQSFLPKGLNWFEAFRSELSYGYIAGAFTPAILLLARKFRFDSGRWPVSLVVHFAAMQFYSGLVKLIWDFYLLPPTSYLHNAFTVEKLFRSISWGMDYGTAIYLMVLLFHYAAEFYRRFQAGALRSAQLETQLVEARLQALRMQLQPHFLFNTLNSISALVQEEPERAETMIARLADLLRYTLQSSGEHEVPLREELKLIDLYLEIEKTRFEDSLEVQIQIEDECFSAIVPNLILQPLVENAMRHGFSERSRAGVLRIGARRAGNQLLLEVADNGRGLGPNGSPNLREGIGLGATRRRLDHLYGGAQSLVLRTPPSGGLEVCVRIPFQEASREDSAESYGSHQSAHR